MVQACDNRGVRVHLAARPALSLSLLVGRTGLATTGILPIVCTAGQGQCHHLLRLVTG